MTTNEMRNTPDMSNFPRQNDDDELREQFDDAIYQNGGYNSILSQQKDPRPACDIVILEEKPVTHGKIVMAYLPHRKAGYPYVTWFYNTIDNAYAYGHYFNNSQDAYTDWLKRS